MGYGGSGDNESQEILTQASGLPFFVGSPPPLAPPYPDVPTKTPSSPPDLQNSVWRGICGRG